MQKGTTTTIEQKSDLKAFETSNAHHTSHAINLLLEVYTETSDGSRYVLLLLLLLLI